MQASTHPELSCSCSVVKAPKFSHTTPILKSLHWLKVNERTCIEYKILTRLYCRTKLAFSQFLITR